jgi:hypothetical protein
VSIDHVDALALNGFFIAPQFLDPETVRSLIRAVESVEPDEQASRVRRGVTFARRNLLELDFVRGFINSSSVRKLIELAAPTSVAVRAILFDKNDQANWTVPWHQDRSIAVKERLDAPGFGPWSTKAGVVHVQPPVEILRQMLTLRFHLDPCPATNGPLRVIAGTSDHILNAQEVENAVAEREQIACTTDAGGLVVMRPLTFHASSPATVPSHRRVIQVELGPRELPHGLNWAVPRQSSSQLGTIM